MDERAFLRDWMHELDVSQWRSPRALWQRQRKSAEALLVHARRNVPFYQDRLDRVFAGDAVDWARWQEIPILDRSEVLAHNDALKSSNLPSSHGSVTSGRTSGSSGIPVNYWKTRRALLAAVGTNQRGLEWHDFDMRSKMAYLVTLYDNEAVYPHGVHYPYWNEVAEVFDVRSELVCLDVITPVSQQIEWLKRERPRYLHTFPSNAAAIARQLAGEPIEGLEKLYLVGETLSEGTRTLCQDAFRADVVDRYGTADAGPIAMQCPTGTHYHVQSETTLVEVVDSKDRPVQPGESGRVVVTSLQNYAFPLIRYRLDDFVELGPSCSCGRGLPVITRILGRERHMFRFPDGSEVWPRMGSALVDILAASRWQVAQVGPLEIEVRYVPSDVASEPDYAALTEHIRNLFKQDLAVRYKVCTSLAPMPGGKFHDFVCEL